MAIRYDVLGVHAIFRDEVIYFFAAFGILGHMEDLAKQGLTNDKLKTGFYFWLAVSVGFVAIQILCDAFITRTGWAIIPALGFAALAFNSARFTYSMGKAYLFIRRAIAREWYQPYEDQQHVKIYEILEDMGVRCKLIVYRKTVFSSAQRIVCFANDNDFVKFSLRV
jgi:hypothetical protein